MSDLISRRMAIDVADDLRACISVDGYWAWTERLKKLPSAQKKGEWIPCSERLPEHDGEMYLVTDYCEQINRRRIHVSYCYVNREGFWSDVPLGYKVIAWMPLPEPYSGADMRKGEKNEWRLG